MKKHFHISLVLFGLLHFSCLPVLAQWSTLPLGRSVVAATGVNNKALFVTVSVTESSAVATNQVDIYDTMTGQWTTAQLSQPRREICAASIGNLAFFVGGEENGVSSKRVDIYNAATNQWSTAELSQPRSGMTGVSAGGKILFSGGINLPFMGSFSNVVDIYDGLTNQWSTTTIPQVLFSNVHATSVGNKAIFTLQNYLFIYDVTTGQWTTDNIGQGNSIHSVTSLGQKSFFSCFNFTSNSSLVRTYDWPTNQWSTTQLPTSRVGITAISTEHVAFFAGGTNSIDGLTASNVVDVYNETTDQWSTTQFPKIAGGVGATAVGNKALFIQGNVVDIYTVNSALPVNLVLFTGSFMEGVGAQLTWQTSLETNNDHFEIQRSDNAQSFETIARVPGKGTTEARTDYSFTDSTMPGQLGYYRLKQVDLDGRTHLSRIISVNRKDSRQPLSPITIGPVPTSGSLTLQVSAGITIGELSVYDLKGRRLLTQTGSQTSTDVSALPVGVYLLVVLTTDGQRLHTRFVRQ